MDAQKKTPLSSGWQALGGVETNYGRIMNEIAERIKSWFLEREIRGEMLATISAPTRDEARAHAARMRELIALRSDAQVARMERRRGLA